MAETGNLYLDFRKNQENLERYVQGIHRLYPGHILPAHSERLLDTFLETVFGEGMAHSFYFANTSLKKNYLDVTVRPKIEGPLLEEAFPAGLVLCVRGHLSPLHNAVLVVDRITEIANSARKDFEVEVTARTFYTEAKVYQQPRNDNVLSESFIAALPPISQKTRENLTKWHGYLDWQEQLIQAKLQGVRYGRMDVIFVNNGQGARPYLVFYVITENQESYGAFQRYLKNENLMAFPLDYSRSPWAFEYNENYRHNGVELGDFARREVEFTEEDWETVRESDSEIPWQEPYGSKIFFELTDTDQNEVANAEGSEEELKQLIQPKYHKQGFLGVSAVGDLALLRRQRKGLEKLETESGYAPFLSSWLFDIRHANLPVEKVEITDWLMPDINEAQKEAVQKMLAAPDIFLLQGPPGTGKTTVIAEAIYQFVRRGRKVLLASQAHLAVDNAMEKLAHHPEIRCIRLGQTNKFSEEGKEFAEEYALQHFYQALAQTAQKNYLEVWEKLDRDIESWRTWLNTYRLLHQDSTAQSQEAKTLHNKLDELERACQNQEERLTRLRRENEEREHTNRSLESFTGFLGTYDEGINFVLPAEILTDVWSQLIEPMVVFKGSGLDIACWSQSPDSCLTSAEKSEQVKQLLVAWHKLYSMLPALVQEMDRLSRSLSEGADPRVKREVWQLKEKLARLEREMEEDEGKVKEWKNLRKQIAELEKKSGIPVQLYASIFQAQVDGRPFYQQLLQASPQELQKILGRTRDMLEKVAGQLSHAKEIVWHRIQQYQEACRPHPVDMRPFEQKKAELSRVRDEYKDCLASWQSKQKELERHLSLRQTELGLTDEILPAGVEQRVQALLKPLEEQKDGEKFRRDWEPFLQEWTRKLNLAETVQNDQEHLLDLYIQSCNVVGVTCNEKRQTLEEKKHTFFDVAIIDEVSKATPPELLMAMLMAKKSVLVGDHRQLPPLFKEHEESYRELVERKKEEREEGENDAEAENLLTEENFKKHEEMVTSSLFKKHFEEAPQALKAALFIQYRMHPDIMDVVNPFYEYKLQCGLKTPDRERNHQLTIPSPDNLALITPDRHAIWIDTSRDPVQLPCYEQQKGTSRTNRLEAILIAELLQKMDAQYQKSGYGEGDKKSVAVITFYGKQVREIRSLIPKHFQALRVTVNTVDRFQGKERPIVFVSLVRNKPVARKSQKAFVAQFERVNVAFSRAQELLIILGAKAMFYDYPIELPCMDKTGTQTKPVYRDIIENINRKSCFWPSSRIISPQDYATKYANRLEER